MSANPALYVYTIVPDTGADPDFGPIGINSAPVFTVSADDAGIAAVVHAGSPIAFQGSDDDVRRWVLEHSRVVERAWETCGTTLPVTFNVIVKSDAEASADDRLRAWLRDSADRLRSRLDALRDRVELRIEIALDRDAVTRESPRVEAVLREMADKPAGMRRLLERKLEQVRKDAAAATADQLYPDIRRRIAAITEDLVENRRARTNPDHEFVFSAAVLTHRSNIESIGAELARIQAEQPAARIRFLGPWPCYSFSDPGSLDGPGAVGGAPDAALRS